MPYELRTKGNQYCVAKAGGEVLKCYDDKGKAVKYLRALWANVEEGFAELSMHVIKANLSKDGEMRIRMVSSDTGKDAYDENMSVELFDDFIGRIKEGNKIPAEFNPDGKLTERYDWNGGMPYISIAHYRAGENGQNVPGEIRSIYRDGNVLKATGVLYDTPLGRAVFKSLQKDLVEKREDKARISIGFLDLGHSHGEKYAFVKKSLTDKCPLCKDGVGDKIYKKGCLVHLALTRVPANPRTDVEVERSMTTKREDAESIVEDEEVIKGLDLRSQAEDEVLVVKAEEECEDEGKKKKKGEMMKEDSTAEPVQENTVFTPAEPVAAQTPVHEPTPVERSFVALVERINAVKSQGLSGEDALKAIQGDFEKVGETIKAEFTPPPSPDEVAQKSMETTLRSLLNEILPSLVAPIQAEVESLKDELRAKSLASTPIRTEQVETVQRSLPASVVQRRAIENLTQKAMSQFDLIARQSVGLQ